MTSHHVSHDLIPFLLWHIPKHPIANPAFEITTSGSIKATS
ncbi:hypothetical protein SynSYN20_02008 [Synechococcus sp. SYN20]|nr:hypothetical protein SynSYN20_02008 [Synechococcus sp. SYN20]